MTGTTVDDASSMKGLDASAPRYHYVLHACGNRSLTEVCGRLRSELDANQMTACYSHAAKRRGTSCRFLLMVYSQV